MLEHVDNLSVGYDQPHSCPTALDLSYEGQRYDGSLMESTRTELRLHLHPERCPATVFDELR